MKKLFQEGGSQARNWWLSSGIIFTWMYNALVYGTHTDKVAAYWLSVRPKVDDTNHFPVKKPHLISKQSYRINRCLNRRIAHDRLFLD